MIEDFTHFLFGETDKKYQEWLFHQNKDTLTFGLIATLVLTSGLAVGDFFYYENILAGKSYGEWMIEPNNILRLIVAPIVNIFAILLSLSSWVNTFKRVEYIGISVILFTFFAIFYTSVTTSYLTANDFFTYEVLPLIILSQILYGFKFRVSFFLNLGMVGFIFSYSVYEGMPFSSFFWAQYMIIFTWLSILLGSLKLEQYRVQNFKTISKLAKTNRELTNAQQAIKDQRQLMVAGENVSQIFSFSATKDLKTITLSAGAHQVIEVEDHILATKEILKTFRNRLHPEDTQKVIQQIEFTKQGNFSNFDPFRILLPNGNVKWLQITLADNLHESSLIFGTIQDVTQEIILKLELQEQTQKLKHRNDELQQFAYASSHDLQEPLRTITNFVGLLNARMGDKISGENRVYMNLIQDSARRMSDLILAILDYSRIGRNKKLTEFDCNIIIKNVKNDLDYLLMKANGQVIIENTLPKILGYKTEFTILFQNIIENALKFKKEGVSPLITIHSHSDEEAHHFCIQDNGIGMEQKYANKIFHLFSRLHTKDAYEGTGIGLTHCKKIVELHGGKIWVESVKGQGTSIQFNIPKNLKIENPENTNILAPTS